MRNLEKIKKLLSLSKSDNQAESQLAFIKAKKLADEEGIDISLIEINSGKAAKKEEFIKDGIRFGARVSITQKFIDWILMNHFNVELIYSGNRKIGQTLFFLGRKSDVEFAKFVNCFLDREFIRHWETYKQNTNANTKQRNSFFWGLYQGLNEKLNEAKKEIIKEKVEILPQSIQCKYAMVVVGEKQERESFKSKLYPKLRNRTVNTGGSLKQDVYGDGKQFGRLISINRPITAS